MNLEFTTYSQGFTIKLEDNIKNFQKNDINELVRKNAKSIAKRLNKDEKRLIKAIENKDKDTINEYISGLDPFFAEELIFNLSSFDKNNIVLGVTTGLLAKAHQKGIQKANPIIVQGLIVTKDNKIVIGLRNKPSFRKNLPDEPTDYKLMLCPAGYATFNNEGNLIKSFYKELDEELGLKKEDILQIEKIGHNKDIGFTEGVRITYLVFSTLFFEEIITRWKSADHSWEYVELVGLDFHYKYLIDLLNTKKYTKYSEKAKGIIQSSLKPPIQHIIENKMTNI